jgi:hypothetical protein
MLLNFSDKLCFKVNLICSYCLLSITKKSCFMLHGLHLKFRSREKPGSLFISLQYLDLNVCSITL